MLIFMRSKQQVGVYDPSLASSVQQAHMIQITSGGITELGHTARKWLNRGPTDLDGPGFVYLAYLDDDAQGVWKIGYSTNHLGGAVSQLTNRERLLFFKVLQVAGWPTRRYVLSSYASGTKILAVNSVLLHTESVRWLAKYRKSVPYHSTVVSVCPHNNT